jgi:hypothetical protein
MSDEDFENDFLDEVGEFALSCYADSPVDWDDFLYRVEDRWGIDLGGNMLDPRILKIKAAVRRARRGQQ